MSQFSRSLSPLPFAESRDHHNASHETSHMLLELGVKTPHESLYYNSKYSYLAY